MEDGAIVEQGNHDSLLLDDDGAYARLYNAQFVAPEESAVA
jgi:ATP-binding cassette subfamily B protein